MSRVLPAGLLDTCVVIELGHRVTAKQLPRVAYIAAQTLGELSIGPAMSGNDPVRAAVRTATLQAAEILFQDAVLPYDAACARTLGEVVADVVAAGRTPRSRVVDLQIAAVAITNSLPLYTVNVDDFKGISRLRVLPVTLN